MYQNILTPLDGSKLAECSLNHVKAIATGCNSSKVVLIRVVNPVRPLDSVGYYGQGYKDYSPDFLSDAWTNQQVDAEAYLSEVADKFIKENIPVETVLVPGDDIADTILSYAKNNGVDLIITSTRGKSGPSRWLMGSVADRVVNNSPVPVLVVAPTSCDVPSKKA